MEAKELLKYTCEALLERKGCDIEVLHIEELTTLTEYFVICSATSTTQVKALADSVEFHLKNDHGIMPHHVEGFESSSWILLDYGSMLVHIFLPETRDFYRLENLWKDGEKVPLSDLGVKEAE
ncbi:ribosome silencing factor [Intestinibacillus sp. Marseille-P6563]|uniref:ribosome silencing factor n=1 Tax=Intestinibacillus sp. Marseille-P6563 TaxID=2364792 RepID=UPI000F06DD0A|nr:ribosome silencing factor [Intestinibacillus sp. Marseille-P6563]